MFSEVFRLFIRNPIIGLPNVILALLTAAASRFMLDTTYFTDFNSAKLTTMDSIPAGLAWSISQFFLFLILTMMLEPMVQSITNVLCINVITDHKEAIPDSFRRSLKYYWRILGILVFKFFVSLGIIIVAFAAAFPFLKDAFKGQRLTGEGIASIAIFIILLLVLALFIMLLNMIMLPMEPLLVYENLSLGESISKGFRYGLNKFLPLLGVSIVMLLAAGCINFIIGLFIGTSSGISTVTSSFLSAALPLYIIYVYKAENYTSSPTATDFSHASESQPGADYSKQTGTDADADTDVKTEMDVDVDAEADTNANTNNNTDSGLVQHEKAHDKDNNNPSSSDASSSDNQSKDLLK